MADITLHDFAAEIKFELGRRCEEMKEMTVAQVATGDANAQLSAGLCKGLEAAKMAVDDVFARFGTDDEGDNL